MQNNLLDQQNIGEILSQIYERYKGDVGRGKVADYIPALAKMDPDKYSISVCCVSGEEYSVGDAQEKFSIQSISKVLTLAMLAPKMGDDIWMHVGKEPSGNSFNSLVQLEYEKGIPRNPFINAGALVITDQLLNFNPYVKDELLAFIRRLAGSTNIDYNTEVAESEYLTGERNKALAHLMKSFRNFDNSVKRVIDVYCHQCSIGMTTLDLARAFLFLANGGVNPLNGEVILSPRSAKRINALMLTCGLYNESGDFAYDISANLSWARAKWDHFEETEYSDPDQIRIKKKSGFWTDREFGYVSDGLFTSQEEINALPYSYAELGGNNATLRPGDVKYKDINGDGVLDWKDQREIGKGDTPHWFYGLSGFFSYRNLDLEAVFQGAAGYSVRVNGNVRNKRTYDFRWTEATNDPHALEPRLGGAGSNYWASDYWLKPVSYLRLKNIAIGYTIPKKLLSVANIEKLRLYISATNLFTLSSVSEYNIDPEVPTGSADQYYPQQRTISFGVNLSF